jgi:hypothetical protein
MTTASMTEGRHRSGRGTIRRRRLTSTSALTFVSTSPRTGRQRVPVTVRHRPSVPDLDSLINRTVNACMSTIVDSDVDITVNRALSF